MLYSAVSLPTIVKQPDDEHVTIHKSATFYCIAHGFRLKKILWKRIKQNLPITAVVKEEKSLNTISSILKITEIVGYYSGQYYCVVENEAGKVTSQIANLHVQGSYVTIFLANKITTQTFESETAFE